MVTNVTFLHNTKRTSSKMGEDKDREKHRNKPQERCLSHMKMLQVTLNI